MSAATKQPHDHGAWSDPEVRSAALAEVMVTKGIAQADLLQIAAPFMEHTYGPLNGAKVVARAWTDAAYRERLLRDGTAAIAELGFSGPEGGHMVVLENTPTVHNVVCCTLCSCYPWPVLGLPPDWYKSPPYRARVVREPRSVLREFGVELDDSVEIRVWDSNAETRYLVLPMRPEGTENLSEEELAALVTRDSMIGTGLPPRPSPR